MKNTPPSRVMSSRAINFGCKSLMVAKTSAQMVPEPAYRRIESSCQSNLWVASLPLTSEEEKSLRLEEINQTVSISSNFWTQKWTHELPLPAESVLTQFYRRFLREKAVEFSLYRLNWRTCIWEEKNPYIFKVKRWLFH